jgi:hypothetical protein
MFVKLSLSLFTHVTPFFLSPLSCPLSVSVSFFGLIFSLPIYLFFSLSLSLSLSHSDHIYIYFFCYFQRRKTPTPAISFTRSSIDDMDSSSSSSHNWLGFSLSNHHHQHSSSLSLFSALEKDAAAAGATDLSMFIAGPKLEDFLGGSTATTGINNVSSGRFISFRPHSNGIRVRREYSSVRR